MTTLADAFLQDILEHPEDDFPRLALADWLDEQGQGERAELIRVQCALAAWPCECDEVERIYHDECRCKEKGELQRRELELLARDFRDWFPREWPRFDRPNVTTKWRRGFVEHIALPCAVFMEHAGALFRAQPIQSVELDLYLGERDYGGGDERPAWFRGTSTGPWIHGAIPLPLWDAMTGGDREHYFCEFGSGKEAEQVLSLVCVRYGRRQAGLTSADTSTGR
jgi:uncharacterized protein (TIGR02996 family)